MRPGGGRAIQLTDWQGLDSHPTWSRDGQSLYYVSAEGEGENGSGNIRQIRINRKTGLPKGDSRQITQFKGASPMFPKALADGKRLAFLTSMSTQIIWDAEDGRDADTGRALVIGRSPQLSPDGKELYFFKRSLEESGLYRTSTTNIDPKSIIHTPNISVDHTIINAQPFELDPKGEMIAFNGIENGQSAIYTVPSSGGMPTKLADISIDELITPSWSPDGSRLAYADGSHLFVMDHDGTERTIIATIYRWQPWSIRWSPDGKYIACFGYEEPTDWEESVSVFVVPSGGGDWKRLTPMEEPEYKEGLEWHPDGTRLTYMRYGPGEVGAQIRWAYLDGSPTSLFISRSDYWDYVGCWAPDGDRFYFSSFPLGEDGGPSDFVYSLSTDETRVVSPDSSSPRWSTNGKKMVWTVNQNERQFWLMDGL